ncbi:B- and T-lymphocyte attenuator [Candoia aspera]|uniref:B- and T-lymphocyte attenuator n=1 Tax=Candoia aspera TaxID=51853 RepID=UPI002FD807D1
MYIGNFVLQFLLLMLMKDNLWAHDSEDDNCTTITIERGTKYHKNRGDSAILECPVTYCRKKPEMNWYMLNKSEKKFHILYNGKGHSISWMNKKTFVLDFQSVDKNDSGQYRCKAIAGKKKFESHVIELIVQDPSNSSVFLNARNTTEDQELPEKMLIVIYSISSLGTLFLISGCFGWLCFKRRPQVKNATGSSSPESGINKNTQLCNDGATHVLGEGSTFNEDSMPCLLQVPNRNQDNYQTASRTGLSSIYNEGLPGDKENPIIYATLSHGELFQKNKSFDEIELTEYAIIRPKN